MADEQPAAVKAVSTAAPAADSAWAASMMAGIWQPGAGLPPSGTARSSRELSREGIPPSSAARSTREPSREGKAPSSAARSTREPSREGFPPSSAARSTREPSREGFPSSGTARSTRDPSREGIPQSSTARSTPDPSLELPPVSARTRNGLHAEGGGEGRSKVRPSSGSRRSAGVVRERQAVLDMVDDETAMLRPQLHEQSLLVQELKDKLKAARKKEQLEARQMTMDKAARLQRKMKVTSHMQAAVRGWLVRRRVVKALDHSAMQNLNHAAMLPSILRDQLRDLQHGVHDLKYREDERLVAAVRLQAWWRSIIARRVVKVIRIYHTLRVIRQAMSSAALSIQAWYRGTRTKLRLRNAIRARMEDTRRKQYQNMETALKCIIQIQRGFRGKLARGRRVDMEEARQSLIHARTIRGASPLFTEKLAMIAAEDEPVLIDTWQPAATPGAVPAGSGNAGVIIDSLPRHDWEVEKIKSLGLVPFYEAASEKVLRHQIGGPTALLMQQQLAIAGELSDEGEGDAGSLQGELGDVWNIYPKGLTPSFLTGLDPDVWEHGGRGKSQRNALRLRGVRKSSRRRKRSECRPLPCTSVVVQPPSNAEERAQIRGARKLSEAADESVAAMDLHPMFINAPPLPAQRSAPASRSARFIQDDQEGFWGQTYTAQAPVHRTERLQQKALEEASQWQSLNVPAETAVKRWRPGEVDHDRVWSIANSLAEQLPALTAG